MQQVEAMGLIVYWSSKLQALVYGILHPTTAINGNDISLRKLSANGQFFVSAQMAQMAVSL